MAGGQEMQGGNLTRRPVFIVTLSVFATLIVAGAVMSVVDSQAKSTSKSICVNKKTQELKLRKNCRANEVFFISAEVIVKGGNSAYDTWLELGNKGTKQQFLNSLIGPGGSSGTNTQSYMDSVSCDQKIQSLNVANWHVKSERASFEQRTGCRVRDSNGAFAWQSHKILGHPYISSWEFIEPLVGGAGGGALWDSTMGYSAKYKVKVENLTMASGREFQICRVINGNHVSMEFEDIGSGYYLVKSRVTVSLWEFSVLIDLGLREKPNPVGALPDGITADADCYSAIEMEGSVGTIVRFNESPEVARAWATAGFNYGVADYLTQWGW